MSATNTKDKYVYGARGEASGDHEGCQQPIPKTNMYMVQGVKLAGTTRRMSATNTKDKYVYGARGEASGDHEGCQQPIPKTNMYMVQGVKLAGTM